MMKYLQLIVMLVLYMVLLAGCGSDDSPANVLIAESIMGTIMHISLNSDVMSKSDLEEIAAKAVKEVKRIENLMSAWVENSDVNRINSAGKGELVQVDPSTLAVLKKAIKTSKMTNGAFEITVSPLVNLWGFGAKSKEGFSIPSDEEIAEALKTVGHEKFTFDDEKSTVSFDVDGMTIDLAGIAKGYAVDAAISVLKENGIENAMVEVGGEVGVIGRNKKGRKWSVGVKHPLKSSDFLTVLELEDTYVATSGDYWNFFIVNGVRYSHIIDPRTGRPTQSGVTSVTVVGKSCAEADALCTGFTVLDFEESIKIIESLPDIEGIIVKREADDGIAVHVSQGLKDKVKLLDYSGEE